MERPPVRTRTSGCLRAGPGHLTNHSRDVSRPARGKCQHARRRSRGGADARPPQRDCVWRIRRRDTLNPLACSLVEEPEIRGVEFRQKIGHRLLESGWAISALDKLSMNFHRALPLAIQLPGE
jgi:hypothetical protein